MREFHIVVPMCISDYLMFCFVIQLL